LRNKQKIHVFRETTNQSVSLGEAGPSLEYVLSVVVHYSNIHTIFEDTWEIQRLIISRAISDVRIR
jgi:hypothetical protein